MQSASAAPQLCVLSSVRGIAGKEKQTDSSSNMHLKVLKHLQDAGTHIVCILVRYLLSSVRAIASKAKHRQSNSRSNMHL